MLFSVIISILTLTISSNSEVKVSGDIPEGVKASYTNTYQKGQMTAGNHSELVLTGLEPYAIQGVTLYMRSNQKSGAGRLEMRVGNDICWEIADHSFDDPAWAGTYSTEYVPITHDFDPQLYPGSNPISICVSASKNSLYISHYEIQYTVIPHTPHRVEFKSSVGQVPSSMQEQKADDGIRLPAMVWEAGGWYFAGWMEQTVEQANEVPIFYHANEMFYPKYDCTLHALFTNKRNDELCYPSLDIQSGEYLIYVPSMQRNLYGGADQNIWWTESQEMIGQDDEGMWLYMGKNVAKDRIYVIEIQNDSIGTCQNLKSGEWIGIKDGKLANTKSDWVVEQDEQGMCQWHTYENGKRYDLCYWFTRNYLYQDEVVLSLFEYTEGTLANLLLFPMEQFTQDVMYSSYPLHYIESVRTFTHDAYEGYHWRFGTYELQIRNGQKRLETGNR